jgi:probable F420-dependent oxidoreductase
MDFGLALPQFDFSVPGHDELPWPAVLEWAGRAEALGFTSLWLADHLLYSIEKYGGPPDQWRCLDPLPALAGVARATTTARIGTLVLCAQLRPPTLLAKAMATLDVLSGGRLTIGIGAGWNEPEYAVAGIPFERPGVRLEQLTEAVEILRGMLGGGPFTFDGAHYAAHDAPCRPAAVQQPAPPIWVGGRGDRLLALVAGHADGWNTAWSITPAEWHDRTTVLDAACHRLGRDPASVTRSVGLYALVGEDEADLADRWRRLGAISPPGVLDGLSLDDWRVGRLVGTVDQVAEQLAGWGQAGVDTLIANLAAVPFSVTTPDDLELLARACRLAH